MKDSKYATVEKGAALGFKCSVRVLLDHLAVVSRAVPGRTSLPILGNVLMEAGEDCLHVRATDLELQTACLIQGISPPKTFATTVPAKKFIEILGSFDRDAEIEVIANGGSAYMKCGRSKYTVVALPPEEYPALSISNDSRSVSLPCKTLCSMIDMVSFAVSPDATRTILTGVLFQVQGKSLKMVATDTHRLAVSETTLTSVGEDDYDFSSIVPKRFVSELQRVIAKCTGDVGLEFSKDETMIHAETPNGYAFSSMCIKGEYLKFERVIPKKDACSTSWTLGARDLYDATRRAMVVGRNAANRVVFSINERGLSLSSEDSFGNSASENVAVEATGPDVQIAFNGRYVVDVMSKMGELQATIHVAAPLKPVLITPTVLVQDIEFTCVLMPLQIL